MATQRESSTTSEKTTTGRVETSTPRPTIHVDAGKERLTEKDQDSDERESNESDNK